MIPKMDPFTRWMDLRAGIIAGAPVETRRLSDMRGYYPPDLGTDEPDRLVYEVYPVPVEEANSELQCSTTVLQPGRVGDEFHMTKGHFHATRDRSEVYLGLSGTGLLVMATEDGRHQVEPIGPGSLSYVPGGWAHRSVNIGSEPLVFFAVYVGDAGHDYATVRERGLPVRVVAANGSHLVERNPHYRSG